MLSTYAVHLQGQLLYRQIYLQLLYNKTSSLYRRGVEGIFVLKLIGVGIRFQSAFRSLRLFWYQSAIFGRMEGLFDPGPGANHRHWGTSLLTSTTYQRLRYVCSNPKNRSNESSIQLLEMFEEGAALQL